MLAYADACWRMLTYGDAWQVFLLSSQESSMVQEWFPKELWDKYWANLGVTAENGCFYRWGKATWESLTGQA